MKLTLNVIDDIVCPEGRRDRLVFDDVQKGLVLRVTRQGGKSFLAQYVFAGQNRRIPLGRCDALSLADARKAVRAVMGEVANGRDPASDRKAAAAAIRAEAERERLTLKILTEDWERLHLANRRPRYKAEAVRAIRSVFADKWERPAENLDRTAVVRTLDKLAKDHPAMASRAAAYGRALYSWAEKRGTLSDNPFLKLPSHASTASRDRFLSDEECKAVWKATEGVYPAFRDIVRTLMLTAQRRDEVAGMSWPEISPDWLVWEIPGSRTKNGQPHRVPLSAMAIDILKSKAPKAKDGTTPEKPPREGLIFPGERGTVFSGWSKLKADLDKDSGVVRWRLHDLRRTVATGMQRLSIRLEVVEAVLNHTSGSRAGIVGIYQRHDWAAEKRAALETWANHLKAILAGQVAAGNVHQFPPVAGSAR